MRQIEGGEGRRTHDQEAFSAAIGPAAQSARRLLELLDGGSPPASGRTARAAREALKTIGNLWECAARLSE